MGRRKIQIEPITDERNRTVTFVKRKAGLFKKAHELSVLCQVDLAVLIIGHNHKIYEYSSNNTNEIIDKITSATKIQESKFPFDFGDYEKISRISKNPKYLKNSISNVPLPINNNNNAKHSRKESKNDSKMDLDTTNDDNDDESDDDSDDDSDEDSDEEDEEDEEDTTENTSIIKSNKRKQGTTPKSTPNKKNKSSSVSKSNISKNSTPLKSIKKESPSSSTPIPLNHKRNSSTNGQHKRQASNSKNKLNSVKSNTIVPATATATAHAPPLSSFSSSSSNSIPKFNQQISSNNALPLPYMSAQHNSILDTTINLHYLHL
ncbi:unnamed protein product [[Candida] boidinii]|nr:unnamed protein product [[Candida] boidinii]